jgi:dihydrofolate synthase / folylpolyglutamate synthase
VNVFDADCAVLTSIDVDHADFLGATRELIGREKAGIFRPARAAIVADPVPPQSVLAHAKVTGANLLCMGKDFGYQGAAGQWQYWGPSGRKSGLAYPALRGTNQLLNASAALAALDALKDRLAVSMQHVRQGMAQVELPGRFQVLPGRPVVVLDVAHNPHAAAVLADNLSNMGFFPQTWAVFGMLRDKDVAGVVRLLAKSVDNWLVCTLPPPRGAGAAELARVVREAGSGSVREFESPTLAYAAACSDAAENDRIIAFGSFHTVADVMSARERLKTKA